MSHLSSGAYELTNLVNRDHGHRHPRIGRRFNREFIAKTQVIHALNPVMPELTRCDLQRQSDGTFVVSLGDVPTCIIDDEVHCLLTPENIEPEHWLMTRRKGQGHHHVYTIESNDLSAGWINDGKDTDEEGSKIHVKSLTPQNSDDGELSELVYPPTQLFRLVNMQSERIGGREPII